MSERGQLYTLEGIFAGLIILLGLFFALQATTTTPSAAGASNPHVIQDDNTYAEDVLTSMDHFTLKRAALYWGGSGDGFHCSGDNQYYTGFWTTSTCSDHVVDTGSQYPPPNDFGAELEQRFGEQYSYNVRVAYTDTNGNIKYQRMVYQGEPGIGAVQSSTSIVLENDDVLRDAAGDPAGTLENNAASFYAPPIDGDPTDDDVYNVLHVEVTIWRG